MTKSTGTHFNITFIGAGNVACHLAPALKDAGHHIVQVYSRTIESARYLASQVGAKPVCSYDEIEPTAHIYIYALTDDSLQWVLNHIPFDNGLHIHTAGSVPMSVFKASKKDYGCLYPLQTFSKSKRIDLRKVPFFIEANTPENETLVNDIARCFSQKVYHLSSEDRKTLHLAGVFACNFTNLMYSYAETLLAGKNIPFDVMNSIITEAVNKAKKIGPHEAQTGPARRGDQRILDQHIAMLHSDPEWQEIYTLLSEQIKKQY